MDQLGYDIQDSPATQRHDLRKRACRLQRLPPSEDPNRYAASLHPAQCAQNPTFQKNYFIVADESNYMEEGVQVAHLEWDGVVAGRTQEQLRQIGQTATLRTRRAPLSWSKSSAAVFRINALVKGDETWLAEAYPFAVYRRDLLTSEGILNVIDPAINHQTNSKHRVFNGGHIKDADLAPSTRFWPVLIRAHTDFCKLRRFDPYLVRQFCIWCSDKTPSATSKVGLVRIDWNGDLGAADTLVADYKKVLSRREAVASEAHQLLSDIIDGGRPWDGAAITA